MSTENHSSRILWYEALGFSVILVLSWVNELTEPQRFISGIHSVPNWRESVFETLIVILVAIPVMIQTKRLLSRLYFLEGFLRVCSWCKKLDHDGEWVTLEEFFEHKFQTATSHGMCLACMNEVQAKLKTPPLPNN